MTSRDRRVRELYTLPPDEFTSARDRLSKALRDAGDRDGAVRVRTLRRPTAAAWALNRGARVDRKLVEELFDTSDELRRVQSGGAGSAALKEASAARRRAVEKLATLAKDVLGDAGDAHEEDITQTLLAAATDEDVRERLRSGTLERAAAPKANFEDVGSLLVASAGPPRKRSSNSAPNAAPQPPPVDVRAVRRARNRVEKLEAEAIEAEHQAERAARAVREAERDAERLRRQADVAERGAAEAGRRAERARSKAGTARSRADEAAASLADLEGPSS